MRMLKFHYTVCAETLHLLPQLPHQFDNIYLPIFIPDALSHKSVSCDKIEWTLLFFLFIACEATIFWAEWYLDTLHLKCCTEICYHWYLVKMNEHLDYFCVYCWEEIGILTFCCVFQWFFVIKESINSHSHTHPMPESCKQVYTVQAAWISCCMWHFR